MFADTAKISVKSGNGGNGLALDNRSAANRAEAILCRGLVTAGRARINYRIKGLGLNGVTANVAESIAVSAGLAAGCANVYETG